MYICDKIIDLGTDIMMYCCINCLALLLLVPSLNIVRGRSLASILPTGWQKPSETMSVLTSRLYP